MDLSKLTNAEKIIGSVGIVLIIDLLFLPWHDFGDELGIAASFVDSTRTAVQDPHGGYAIVALLVTLVMVLQIVLTKLTSVELPKIPVPWSQVHLIGGFVVAGLLLLKLLVETSVLGFGAWLGILLGGGLAYGGFLRGKEGEPAP